MPPADTHCGRPHGMQPQYPPRKRTGMPGSPAGPLEFFIASPATPHRQPAARAVALERHFLRLTSPAKPLTFNGLRRRLVNGAYMASTLVF